MKRGIRHSPAALAAILLLAACAKREAPPAAAPEPAKPKLEAAAVDRLKAMSATLAAAQAFSFTTAEHREKVNAAGEKVGFALSQKHVLQRPDKAWSHRTHGDVTAFSIYDGKTLSLQGDGQKVWGQVDMPPTIDEALDYAAEVYRFPLPVADFFYSDPYASFVSDDTAASLVGSQAFGDLTCDQIHIETPAVDAELWLEQGTRALPCKLELLYKQVEKQPRFSIVFSDWNLAPAIDPKIFEFNPPKGYERIAIVAALSPEEEKLVREQAKAQSAPANEPAASAPNPPPASN